MHQTRLSLPPLSLNAWLRYDLIQRLLGELHGIETVLEVGAGQGAIGARLAQRFGYTGVEPDGESYARAKERLDHLGRGRMIHGYVSDVPTEELFDLVCAFEVLEHLEDDVGSLTEWCRRARPGGHVMISSPGFPERFGPFDRFAGHYRRYERAGFVDLMQRSGCADVKVFTYGFLLGQVLEKVRDAMTSRRDPQVPMEERTAASGRWMHPSERGGWVTKAVSAPFRLLQRPFANSDHGTGFVAVGRRAAS